jgi:hypothetical protein
MNDFARFFFGVSGFSGFAIFFFLALLIHRDPSLALFHGGLGCLLFAVSGRALLGFVLRGVASHQGASSLDTVVAPGNVVERNSGVLAQEKLTAEQMNEAVAKPKQPIVEAKA